MSRHSSCQRPQVPQVPKFRSFILGRPTACRPFSPYTLYATRPYTPTRTYVRWDSESWPYVCDCVWWSRSERRFEVCRAFGLSRAVGMVFFFFFFLSFPRFASYSGLSLKGVWFWILEFGNEWKFWNGVLKLRRHLWSANALWRI